MIGGITGAMTSVSFAAARFDRAAEQVVTAAGNEGESLPVASGLSDAMATMAAAQFAMLATFHAARTSNEMIMQAIDGLRP